jgi:hypothetical protein
MAMKVRPSDSSISWIVQMFGWFQGGRSLGFALKAAEGLCVVGEFIGKELQGNVATQLQVFRFVDHTHAPAADLADDAVMGDRPTHRLGGRGHWLTC